MEILEIRRNNPSTFLPSQSILTPPLYQIMLQRIITRQTRAFSFSTFSRSLSTPSSNSRLHLSRRSIQSSSFKPLSPRSFQRWQSTDTEKRAEDSSPPPGDAEAADVQEEDPLKKELEAKNREVIDLKVFYPSCDASMLFQTINRSP
jgi:hypothetical protein